MSLFKSSEETGKNVCDKTLIWGPTHTSKTHASLTWPRPAVVDVENRARHFADRFKFEHAEPRTLKDILDIIAELKAGTLACDSFILDSYSAIYEKLVAMHTSTTTNADGVTTAITDYVTVNKRIAPIREFVFSTAGQNLIVIAHAQQKYERQGKTFTKRGIDFVGDEKFRYAFDYVFRTEPTGNDPRTHAVKFHVEKSASPHLKIGEFILVKPTESFYELLRARTHPVTTAPEPISQDQAMQIEVLAQKLGWSETQLADAVKKITRRTPVYKSMDAPEADRLIHAMETRTKVAS